MPGQFNPQDWYWMISSVSTTLVYGSARNVYVDPSTDTDYGNWVTNTGMSPYPATSEGDRNHRRLMTPTWGSNGHGKHHRRERCGLLSKLRLSGYQRPPD